MIISYFGKEVDLGKVIELTDITIAGYSKTFEVYTANGCHTFDLMATSLRWFFTDINDRDDLAYPNDEADKLIDLKTIKTNPKEMIEDQFYYIHKQIENMLNYEKTHK
jgi:hypothetical protein